MKKSFSHNKTQKKNRGVAVIFTLGILGLLTVLALGFASTALLNRKIADNTSSAAYARHIAKNIALARAKWAYLNSNLVETIYSDSLLDPGNSRDFLHKMDTLLDGVEIYRVTNNNSTPGYLSNTARWQYVRDSDGKIVGRYAYAVVPDHGKLDPHVNLGTFNEGTNRFGISEKSLSLPGTWNENLTTVSGSSRICKLSAPNRWKTYKELFAAAGQTDSSIFTNGISLADTKSHETFWLDNVTTDGKRTEDEMYLRFNLTRDWETTTVAQLIDDVDPESSTGFLTLANAGGEKSISFIPWLKNWDYAPSGTTDWTAEKIKKQIAANIIQYNRSEDADTVTDKADDADWLTNFPSYAGIGRHPMLNELGFLIRVRTEVLTSNVSISDDETKKTITYTPIYYITVDAGAELIYPFGPADGLENSGITFSGTEHNASIPKMLMRFKLRKFQKKVDGGKDPQEVVDTTPSDQLIVSGVITSQMLHPTHIDDIVVETTGKVTKLVDSSTVITQMSEDGFAWTNFNLSLGSGDWNASPAYTKAVKFWKENQTGKQQTLKIPIRSLTVTTSRSVGNDGDISEAMARRMKIEWLSFTPGNVVLKYGNDDGGKQRDVAQLEAKTPADITDMATEKIWFIAYEATDPLVNHYKQDWTRTKDSELKWVEWNEMTSLTQDYPGTLYASGDESHVNSTISGKLPLSLTINGATVQETAEDPAYATGEGKRLSTSYIRHGQMKSLWELAFISRAEPFRSLNLARTRKFNLNTSVENLKAGSFEEGDANLLDQVKLSESSAAADDRLTVYGKAELNGLDHDVLKQLFNTNVSWLESLTNTVEVDPFATTGTASTAVCSNANCKNMIPCADPASCPHTDCLAHLLLDRSSILPFSNRSDLLLDPTDAKFAQLPGYSELSSDQQTRLATAQTNLRNFLLKTTDNLCKAEREQYASRFMNLFKCEPVKRAYIIVVAQSIRDIGGGPVFVDLDGDGEYSPAGVDKADDITAATKCLKTGYVRKKLDGSGYEKFNIPSNLMKETIESPAVGTYDYGADKITGETKLIVEMTRDTKTMNWKITGVRYVE